MAKNDVQFKLEIKHNEELVVMHYEVDQADPWCSIVLSEVFDWVQLMERIRLLQEAAKHIEPQPKLDGKTYDPKASRY